MAGGLRGGPPAGGAHAVLAATATGRPRQKGGRPAPGNRRRSVHAVHPGGRLVWAARGRCPRRGLLRLRVRPRGRCPRPVAVTRACPRCPACRPPWARQARAQARAPPLRGAAAGRGARGGAAPAGRVSQGRPDAGEYTPALRGGGAARAARSRGFDARRASRRTARGRARAGRGKRRQGAGPGSCSQRDSHPAILLTPTRRNDGSRFY
jgi:hypothetical protein